MLESATAIPTLLRRMNERKIVHALQAHAPLSRVDIARHTGISRPTVSKTVGDLLEMNLLEEGDFQPSRVGRRGKSLRLASKGVQVLGAVISPWGCELVCSGLDGKIHEQRCLKFPTAGEYSELITSIAQHVRQLMQQRGTPVLGLGVSVPGLVSQRQQRVLISPNLPQLTGRPLGDDLSHALGLETVVVQSMHSLYLAESTCGAAKGLENVALINYAGGLGLVVGNGGRLVEGQSGMAGELGHITVDPSGALCGCGNHGCLETVATDLAVAASASNRLGRTLDIEQVLSLTQSGQLDLSDILDRAVEFLAIGVAAAINIFNPEAVLLYGRFLEAREGLVDRLVELTRRRALGPLADECRIVAVSGRPQNREHVGAVATIIDHVLTRDRQAQTAAPNGSQVELLSAAEEDR